MTLAAGRLAPTILALVFYPILVCAEDGAKLPTIDGRIEDGEWAGAKVFTDFYTIVPKTTEKFYDSTVVYLLQSSDALYFAFRFFPRSKVIRQSLIRDVSSDEENEFFILLDLENKNENGYVFIFNFMGNQRDMAIYNQRTLVPEWDWVWQSKSTVYRDAEEGKPGYIETEVRIPVDKFQNKNRQQIGIDVQMFAYKTDGSSYFYALTPESEILTIKSTYKLDIEPFEESYAPEVTAIPFVVGQTVSAGPATGTAGGDLNFSLDRHKLKTTYRTDESTLEADPFQFSLYGQSIFLEEKRPFLSRDLDIYRTPINLFYTRAIQNIQWGGNYTFRSDALKSGVIAVEDEIPDGDRTDKRHLVIGRSKWQNDAGNFGTTMIYGNNLTTHSVERVAGLDAVVNLPLRLLFSPQWATNTTGTTYQIQLALPRDWAGGTYASTLYRRYGRGFNVSTLFNDYGTDYDEIALEAGYRSVSLRPLFSQMEYVADYYRARTLQNPFTYQEYGSLSFYTLAVEHLNLSHRIEVNRPDEGTPAGIVKRHNFLQDHSAKVVLGPQAFTVGYNFGPYFGSYLKAPYAEVKVIFWDRLGWDFTLSRRSYADVRQTIARIKVDVRLMDRLYFRSFAQKDDYERLGLWNSLLQYEFFSGSNVYLVLNQEGERFEKSGKFFKVGYEVNF